MSVSGLIVKAFCWSWLLIWFLISAQAASAKPKFVSLKVSSERNTYALGEIVKIKTSIRNNTSKVIAFGSDVKSSSAVQIAFGDEKNYKPYAGASLRFMLDGINLDFIIPAKATHREEKELFWIYPSSSSTLKPRLEVPYLEARIANHLAFPRAGKYFIRLVSHVEIDGVSADFESTPIEITVTEPSGGDVAVWEQIRANSDIAYFIQYSEPARRYYDRLEREYLEQRIQKLIAENPTGIYVGQIQRSLHKFRLAEAERNDLRPRYPR